MAYDEFLADRIRQVLKEKSITADEKKMMGGLCFMVDGKMCFGLVSDKSTDTARLMCRVGLTQYQSLLERPHCSEMNFTGRAMKGYVFVSEAGLDLDSDIQFWIQKCLDFNPMAKSSKRR